MKQPNFVLSASILTLLSLPVLHSAAIPSDPSPAYGPSQLCTDAESIVDFTTRDINRLRGNVVRALVRKSPYVDVLPGGTMEAGVSDTQRVVVGERAVLGEDMVEPVFIEDRLMCGQTGPGAQVGSTEYSFSLGTNRGKGPLVCIKGMWSAFRTVYSAAEDAIKKQLVQLNNADVRITLVKRGGCKLVVKSGATFSAMFAGGMQAIDTPFTTDVGVPDAQPNIKLLQYLARVMREDLLVEPFEGPQSDPVMRFIGSTEIIDALRDDAQVREDHRYIAAGSYNVGKMTLMRYTWEGPYRGLTFGVDPQPLRFNEVNASGQPLYIPPEIAIEVDNGMASRPNPAHLRAKYEVAILMGQDSFRKLTPEAYTGEGSFKFPNQGVTGELVWRNIIDNDCNVWGDYGRHYYQFTRAYQPERPHAVCAIAYSRQQTDFGLTSIGSWGDFSSTDSL